MAVSLWLCCDLLEKSYFCSIANNRIILALIIDVVVICLKNRTFAVSQTTPLFFGGLYSRLWFAWKIVLLQYRKQPHRTPHRTLSCCDLLEKSYFCSIANNLLLDKTSIVGLWFAWKIVLLQYRKQHLGLSVHGMPCCDLLEKSYFCSIANNFFRFKWLLRKLWFAWKIVLLQYRKQQRTASKTTPLRCDLLEKSYFCSIANNLNTISICTTNRYKDLRNKKNETAKRNPTQGEWDFFFLIMPGVRTIPAVAQVR